jgi:hypothetical protein
MRLIDADEFEVFTCVVPEKHRKSNKTVKAFIDGLDVVFEKIDAATTIDPESLRPTAHWIRDSGGSTNVVCSSCNAISFSAYNFCPHCGARMVNADDRLPLP